MPATTRVLPCLVPSLVFCFALFALIAPLAAQDAPKRSLLPQHFPAGKEACFGRVYDARHLAAHSKQRVTAMHIFKDLSADSTKEDPPATAQEIRERDGGDGNFAVTAYVYFRDKPGKLFHHWLSCNSFEGERVTCSIDCDGGSFNLKEDGSSLLLQNNGFVVIGGCGESEEEAEQRDFVSPGADDRVFRLDPEPLKVCTALRDSLKPAYAALGAPLRERFQADELCLSRSYDAAHMAAHPKQTVKRIAILKTKESKLSDDYPAYKLSFLVELSDGKRIERKTDCSPDNYAYTCTHDPQMDTQRDFYLTRAGDSEVMLRDKRGVLAKLFDARLGDDDRLFKLRASPIAACSF
jgi:hypothetical protein